MNPPSIQSLPLLLGCGILRREVRFLLEKNGWPMETLFLDSALHVDFDQLSAALQAALAQHAGRERLVFYGACHPRMEAMLSAAGGVPRTEGQNCVEMLLGPDRFTRELEQGAFFLLEDWARQWDRILTKTFGPNRAVMREIIQGDRGYLLAVRTPCSGDFTAEAEAAGRLTGLPVRWTDITLEHLETVLARVIYPGTAEWGECMMKI